MAHWNHRVVVKEYKSSTGEIEKFYGIHEVYYDDKGNPDGVTEESVSPVGDSLTDIKNSLDRMKKACTLPVLNYDTDFKSGDDA